MPGKVVFKTANIFHLLNTNKHKSLFGSFIWSHIRLQELNNFIDTVNNLVSDCGTIVLMDNNYVEGCNLPVTDKDDFGNTYQTRILGNGTTHKVLKNFPAEKFVRQLLADRATEIDFINLQYYWILKYKKM